MNRYDEAIITVISQMEAIYGKLGTMAWTPQGILGLVPDVLLAVERVSPVVGGLTGSEKKALAIDLINKAVDVPYVPEWLERKILSIAIDLIIATVNKWLGHAWSSVLAELKREPD